MAVPWLRCPLWTGLPLAPRGGRRVSGRCGLAARASWAAPRWSGAWPRAQRHRRLHRRRGGLARRARRAVARTAAEGHRAGRATGRHVAGVLRTQPGRAVPTTTDPFSGLSACRRRGLRPDGSRIVIAACVTAARRVGRAADGRLGGTTRARCPSAGGQVPLADYLRTRVLEVVVHGDDVVCSVPGMNVASPPPDTGDDVPGGLPRAGQGPNG